MKSPTLCNKISDTLNLTASDWVWHFSASSDTMLLIKHCVVHTHQWNVPRCMQYIISRHKSHFKMYIGMLLSVRHSVLEGNESIFKEMKEVKLSIVTDTGGRIPQKGIKRHRFGNFTIFLSTWAYRIVWRPYFSAAAHASWHDSTPRANSR